MSYERYYYMPMPINKDGNGPTGRDDTARTLHEVWDDACLTVCTCGDEATARHIADALNNCPIVAEQQCGSEIDRVRNIITQWNFGPLQDRDALDAIFDIVGDNIQ